MSRVISFSRTFPSYHPRKGEPTFFVEKILAGLPKFNMMVEDASFDIDLGMMIESEPKHHTIRAGHRWGVGDWFSPRVWSGVPYKSKQIQFAPDIQIKKIWYFNAEGTDFFLKWTPKGRISYRGFDFSELEKNDGLSPTELFDWICLTPEFKRTQKFSGQVICWNERINY